MSSQRRASWRILTVEDDLTFHGGQERSYLEMSAGLAAKGHEIHLAYRAGGDAEHGWRAAATRTYPISAAMVQPQSAARSSIEFVRSMGSAMGARPDVVYLNQYQDSPLGALVSLRSRAALVCHLRQPAPARYGIQWTAALPQVDRFIAVSDHTRREFVASGLPPESVAVVHLGIDTSRFAPNPAVRATVRREHGWDDDAPVVLYAGRIDREKGLETLLDAWRVLSSEHPRARLVVVGGPRNHASPSAAMAYVAELERRGGPGVIWLPRRTDVTSLYAAADVVVLPSVYAEPSGRTILEGMATGVPVVASNVGGIPEFYDVSLTELLCPAGDAGALVATLRRVLTWRTALPSLGPMCRANAERFPVSAAVDGVEAVIEDAVRHHRARRHRARRRALWQWGRPSR